MCGGVHYGEVEGLVSVERWSCSRGASSAVEPVEMWSALFTVCGGELVMWAEVCHLTLARASGVNGPSLPCQSRQGKQ